MKVRIKCAMTFMAIAAMTFCGLMQRELTEKTPFTEPAGAEGELAGQDLIEGTELTVPVEDTETDQLDIDILNPIIFASYTFDATDGESMYNTLLFEFVSGTYDNGRSLWNREWSGEFRFRTIEAEPGISIDPYENGVISCRLQQAFAGPFQIYMKDYNGDGLMEFAITQFESYSGGDTGRMFTLYKDGTVAELPIKNDRRYISNFGLISLQEVDTGLFLIPYTHTEGSMDLEQFGNGFIVRTEEPFRVGTDSDIYFMGEPGDSLENVAALEDMYQWDGEAFVLTGQRLVYE